MVRSMFAAIAGLKTHQSKMDVIGNNIANCNTYGYKTSRATFQEALYTTTTHSSAGTDTYGGRNAAQVGYGCKLGSIDKIFESSTPAATGQNSDVMIEGNGFFLVGQKLPTGVDGVNPKQGAAEDGGNQNDITSLLLTRVGNFGVDSDGYLVDSQGYVVYGFGYGADVTYPLPDDAQIDETNLVPIRIPLAEGDTTGGGIQLEEGELPQVSITINADGTVMATPPNGETFSIGKIAVANVPNTGGLEAVGSYYSIGSNTGIVEAFNAGDGNTGQLLTGYLEMANVDIANEFADMITTQRGFQANTRIITVTDQMLEELVNMKR